MSEMVVCFTYKIIINSQHRPGSAILMVKTGGVVDDRGVPAVEVKFDSREGWSRQLPTITPVNDTHGGSQSR